MFCKMLSIRCEKPGAALVGLTKLAKQVESDGMQSAKINNHFRESEVVLGGQEV